MKISVYGRIVEVTRIDNQWLAYYTGNKGKKPPAPEIIIPSDIDERNVIDYIADLCHEWVRPAKSQIVPIDK